MVSLPALSHVINTPNTSACTRKINTSPTTVEEKEHLKKLLTTPPVKKIDLHFPLGLEVTARNLKGVTIKDALDAIHKPYKKRVCPFFLSTPFAITLLSTSLQRLMSLMLTAASAGR